MIRTVLFCLVAIATVQALPLRETKDPQEVLKAQLDIIESTLAQLPMSLKQMGIKTTDDLLNILNVLQPSMTPDKQLQVQYFIQALKDPSVRTFVDITLEKLPQLAPLFHGIREFLEGPDAKPLREALQQVIPPMQEAAAKLYTRLAVAISEANTEFLTQGLLLSKLLQTPEVHQVFEKFESLPEVTKLNEITSGYGVDVVKGLKTFEVSLKSVGVKDAP